MNKSNHCLDDLTGKKFGSWTVLSRSNKISGGNTYWNCLCNQCGKTFPIQRCSLIFKTSKQCRECQRVPKYIGHIYKHYYVLVQKRALKRKQEFSISIEYLNTLWEQQQGKCALSKLPIAFQDTGKAKGTASLDRIDSNKGYIKGNVQWVHKDINIMKNSFIVKEFIYLCKAVVETQCSIENYSKGE